MHKGFLRFAMPLLVMGIVSAACSNSNDNSGSSGSTGGASGSSGVTCNAICPSYVRTPLVERQIDDLANANHVSRDDVVEQIMLAPAARKQLLEPSDVAALATFLCSDAAAGITGSAQTIDCGWTAR